MSDLTGWTFSGNMRVTDRGMELLFGREAMAERLLWELTNLDLRDSEHGDVLCCGAYTGFLVHPSAAPGERIGLVSHGPTCPWMRAHRFLNRSTDHGYYVHEFAHTP